MSFLWPIMLLALCFVPLLLIYYSAKRRAQATRRQALATSGLVSTGSGTQLGWKQHLPFAFFLGAITVLLVAFARPQAPISLPERSGTVILALDVSNSMAADDLDPSRLAVAQELARSFVQAQPSSIQIGIVTFGDGALLTQAPTEDRELALSAIDRAIPGGGTSAGQGIFTSLAAIVDEPIIVETNPATGEFEGDLSAIDFGYLPWASIVLLSDGENTGEPDPLEISELAASAGIKIWTIGIGTTNGAVLETDGFRIATALDEQTLQAIADATGAAYIHSDADGVSGADLDGDLASVVASIDLRLTTTDTPVEVTGLFALAAIGLLLVSVASSALWKGRLL